MWRPTCFVFSLNVNFEIYIMYKLSTHNCCLCQINCCCRIFKRPSWLLVYCHVYAPQYVQSGFPVEKLKPVNQESYSRNQSIEIFKSRQITELSSSSSLRLTPLEGYKKWAKKRRLQNQKFCFLELLKGSSNFFSFCLFEKPNKKANLNCVINYEKCRKV